MFAVRILLAVPLAVVATVAAATEPLYLQPRLIEAFQAAATPNVLVAENSASWTGTLSLPDSLRVETFAATDDALFEFIATPTSSVLSPRQTTASIELMSIAPTKSEVEIHSFSLIDWSQTPATTLLEQPSLYMFR